jgi:ubiquinone/menaquinone biosynthesis C-methylase UbiE
VDILAGGYVPGVAESEHVSSARVVYDATAVLYARLVGTELSSAFEGAVDRALLAAFAEVLGDTPGTVADVGCGPGRVAAFLAARGLDVVGVDISRAMLAVARDAHPGLRFDEGQLAALPFADRSLRGVVAWYSIIHTPAEHLEDVFSEFARVLSDGGDLLLAFQAGSGEVVQRVDAYGTGSSLISFRHSVDAVVRILIAAGLEVRAQALREPEMNHESTRQAFVLARRVLRPSRADAEEAAC